MPYKLFCVISALVFGLILTARDGAFTHVILDDGTKVHLGELFQTVSWQESVQNRAVMRAEFKHSQGLFFLLPERPANISTETVLEEVLALLELGLEDLDPLELGNEENAFGPSTMYQYTHKQTGRTWFLVSQAILGKTRYHYFVMTVPAHSFLPVNQDYQTLLDRTEVPVITYSNPTTIELKHIGYGVLLLFLNLWLVRLCLKRLAAQTS